MADNVVGLLCINLMNFSVITSVYRNDKPDYVRVALESMLVKQSVKPTEIIMVIDGPVPEGIDALISDFEVGYPNIFRVIRLPQNKGLGNALRLGVENASFDTIARMDSDDICLPDRFEKQLAFMESNPEVDIVGGQMTEFIGEPENIIGIRNVPLDNADIYKFMRGRCGLNHVTVMFKKASVIKAGNYQDWYWNEDYYLWVRMMALGCLFANIPDVLVNVRSGSEQYARRGGRQYFESNKGIQDLLLDNKLTTTRDYCINIAKYFIVQRMLPNFIRGWVYRVFARKRNVS